MGEALHLRHRLEDMIETEIEKNHIGLVEGGSSGSGTMEIFVYTDNLSAIKRIISRVLKREGLKEKAVIEVRENELTK